MQIAYSQREAHSLSMVLAASRVLTAVAIDGGNYGNSGWICVIAGFILNLPLAIAVDRRPPSARGGTGILPRIGGGILALISIFEAATVMRIIVNSISYSEMLTIPVTWITVATLLGCFYAICKNGSGICNAARIWIYIFLLIFAVVIIAQLKLMKPRWLTPVFGPGMGALAEGTVAVAGYQAAVPMIHSLSVRENKKRVSCVASLGIASLAALMLCLFRGMMAPVLTNIGLTRYLQFDTLITNGRESLSLQLPLLVALHAGFIVSLAGYSLVAAGSIQRITPKLDGRVCGAIALGLVFLLCMINAAESDGAIIAAKWEFVSTSAALLLLLISGAFGKAEGEPTDYSSESW